MIRRLIFLSSFLAGCSGGESPDFIEKGAAALARLQAADGTWKSLSYPDMKQGPALTALALFTLARLPQTVRSKHEAAVERAQKWLLERLTPDGQVGEEYPNFTTSFTLRAMMLLKPAGWEEASKRMAGYLVRAQCVGANGWVEAEAGFGGWGLGGTMAGKKEKIRLDISTTRHMLQALAAADRISEVRVAARVFVLACQNDTVSGLDRKDDGGFCYSRANPHQNKADVLTPTKTGFRSYGTATADGLLALRALGEDPASSFPVRLAREWLEKNFSAQGTPGFSSETREPWDKGLLLYYLYSVSEALRQADSKIQWREPIVERLKAMQAPDGTWTNPVSIMKEDEPVIATCFALLAWANTR
jgi:hypothetical protein